MSFDAHANFVLSAVAIAPSPASSGTSLTVTTGDGAKFPSVPFNCTVWPSGLQATAANAEIVRLTNIAGDVLTIARAQEGTTARAILVGDEIAVTITKKTIADIEAKAALINPDNAAYRFQDGQLQLWDAVANGWRAIGFENGVLVGGDPIP